MKNKLLIFCVFLCCAIIVLSIFFVYSKYKKGIAVKTVTQVAEPIFEIVKPEIKEIDFLNRDKYYYEFSIRNFKDNLISEVSFKYSIEFILSQNNAPIIINLYRLDNGEKIKLELKNNRLIEEEYFIAQKEEKFYVAEIMYDNTSKEILEADLDIKLNVNSVQFEEVNV